MEQIEKIFVETISNWKTGKLSLDELSSIALTLWWKIVHKDAMGTDMESVLEECSELNFCSRVITDESEGCFVSYMKDVMRFYKEHQNSK